MANPCPPSPMREVVLKYLQDHAHEWKTLNEVAHDLELLRESVGVIFHRLRREGHVIDGKRINTSTRTLAYQLREAPGQARLPFGPQSIP